MKFLRHSLTFVMGMILGIIIIVIAVGGTVLVLGTQMTVGKLQQTFIGEEIIKSDSAIYDKKALEAVQFAISDIQNLDTLSLKTLYEHYGIDVFKGVSGLNFSDKEFYDQPITAVFKDASTLINSFSLNEISVLLGKDFDFSKFNLPILNENLDVGISTAITNILNSVNGDLSIRRIKNTLGLDLGVDDNDLIRELQDIKVSDFGKVLNVLRLDTLLNADTDTFVKSNYKQADKFVKVDAYERVSTADLKDKDKVLPGARTYLYGAKDSDGDGTTDTAIMKEIRYKKTGEGEYVVDNSCYADGFVAQENSEFYRFREFRRVDNNTAQGDLYVEAYANKVETVGDESFTLLHKQYVLLNDVNLKVENNKGLWAMTDETVTKSSRLHEVENASGDTYIRIHEGESSHILQTVAYMSLSDLSDANDMLSKLTIGDIVTINENTSKLVVALKNSTLDTIGEDINDLALGDILDIVSDEYTPSPNGKYVYIEEENYYTPYNPALHKGMERYNRTRVENSSSALLQRFAGATLGGFSEAFSDLSLADVMQINGDVYAVADANYINTHKSERFFYYDSEIDVYLIADEEYRAEHTDTTYYRVASSGGSTGILKKLAFVKVDNLAPAMEAAMDDMMVSEILDIYSQHAIEVTSPVYDANASYFIEYGYENSGAVSEEIDGKKFVYVLDSFGDYTLNDYTYTAFDMSHKDNYQAQTIRYGFRKFTELSKNMQLANMAIGNLYYFDGADKDSVDNYHHDTALCNYLIAANHQNIENVYCKVTTPNGGLKGATIYSSKDGAKDHVYVRDPVLGYIQVGTKVSVTTEVGTATVNVDIAAFADLPYFMRRTKLAGSSEQLIIALDDLSIDEAEGALRYSRRQCETIYVKDPNGAFVYVGGQFVGYDATEHAGLDRYVEKTGYIASAAEAFYTDSETNEMVCAFSNAKGVNFKMKKSAAVIRLLAKGTIGNMSKVIENATVGDIIEADSGSLFDKELIRTAKITELDSAFKKILTEMSVGDLIEWSEIDGMDKAVKAILRDIPIANLFKSLSWDEEKHTLYVDMLKLYGYKSLPATDPK
ncbi:MAG: hypothetical protein K2J16_06160, partial [Clostridia bacterium]|nr:hypothetical protein [Clostridia bacterium]